MFDIGGAAMGVPAGDPLKYEVEFEQIQGVVDRLYKEADATVAFLVDKNGQVIAADGDPDYLAKSPASFRPDRDDTEVLMHIQRVGDRAILVTLYPPEGTSFARVRRCMQRA